MRIADPKRGVPTRWARLAAVVLTWLATAAEGAADPKPARPKAPADHVLFESDLGGAYFVARPLKDAYDTLLKRVAELKGEIEGASIDESKARREIDRLQGEIDETIRRIDRAKLYVPGAAVSSRTETRRLPLLEGDLLFVEADDVEIRAGESREAVCVVEKTVLGEPGKDPSSDFEGIALDVRRSSGKETFGYYKGAAGIPALRHDYEAFPFKPFLDREFHVVTIKGLAHQEGNRQIELDLRNEQGQGRIGSEWRRHAKLILTLPKCGGVGVRGALGGFRVVALQAPLMVEGEGNRDYRTRYEIARVDGPLTASNIPIHRLDGIRGDVSLLATAYAEDVQTQHDARGVQMRSVPPRESSYKDIHGDLRVRACRVDLTLEGTISGRVDIENDFGKTTWRCGSPLAPKDHRIVSQSGAVALSLSREALGKLRLALFTECGGVHLPKGEQDFHSRMFTSAMGDVTRRSWHGFLSGKDDERNPEAAFALFTRLPAAVLGRPRSPGLDVISRSGTITFIPLEDKGR